MGRGFLPLAVAVTAIAAVWLAAIGLRRPYLRRMGIRHLLRRPAETGLIVLGSVLGTALITGSFLTGDSLTSSFTEDVYRRLGEIDQQVELVSDAGRRRAEDRINAIRALPGVDGAVLAVLQTGVARQPGGGDSEPRAQLFAMDLADLDGFGSTPQSVSGPSLAKDEAVVTAELAEELDLTEGDDVEISVFGKSRSLRVVRVAEGDGWASISDGEAVFVHPGLIDDLRKASGTRSDPSYLLFVSNEGDSRAGADLTRRVTAALERIFPPDEARVVEIKRSRVEFAETAAEGIGQLFLVVGSFAVIAGILLLVNIFVMLSVERKSELGMLRAVGMRRSDLVRGFVFEGAMYGGLAAVVGGLVGIGVGAAIVYVAGTIFAADVFGPSIPVSLDLKAVTVIAGILTGFAISFVTIAFTSARISRINIIAAIRDLNETKAKEPRLRSLLLGLAAIVAGVLMAFAGVTQVLPIPAIIGPGVAGLGATAVLTRFLSRRFVISVVGLGVLAWGVGLPFIMTDLFAQAGSEVVFVVHGLVVTFAAVAFLSQNQEVLSGGVRWLVRTSPRRGLAARLATTYPVARRFRTAMTMLMYALIVFTLMLISIIGYVQEINVEAIARQESSGYDILARTNQATPPLRRALLGTPGVDTAVGILSAPARISTLGGDRKEGFVAAYGIDAEFLRLTSFGIDDRDAAYASDDDVWEALLEDPSLIVLDGSFAGNQQGPPTLFTVDAGEVIELADPVSGKTEQRRVIGFTESGITLGGAVMSERALSRQFATAAKTEWLVKVTPGADPAQVAQALDAEHESLGMQARAFDEVLSDILGLQLRFFGLLRGYLALGLFVGIVGLGVIMIRAVRERRRAIGVLRALGFAASTVRRAFVGEAGLVAAEGIGIGVALGVVTARNLLTSGFGGELDVPFAVPWPSVGILVAVAFGFSLLVAALPARAASRIRPAVALRIAD
jgi:putative ABC transport system permease protein